MARTKQVVISWTEITADQLLKIVDYILSLHNSTKYDNPDIEISFRNKETENFDKTEDMKAYLQSLDFEGYNKIETIVISTGWRNKPKVRVSLGLKNEVGVAGVFTEVKTDQRDQAKIIAEKIVSYFNAKKTYNWLLGSAVGSLVAGMILISPAFFLIAKSGLSMPTTILMSLAAGSIAEFIALKLINMYPKLVIDDDNKASGRSIRRDWLRALMTLVIPLALGVVTELLTD